MTQMTSEQRVLAQTARWTEAEVTAFVQAIGTFRDNLPPPQRAVFNAMLATAGAAIDEDDVQGYLVVPAIVAVMFPPPLPEKDSGFHSRVPGNLPPPSR